MSVKSIQQSSYLNFEKEVEIYSKLPKETKEEWDKNKYSFWLKLFNLPNNHKFVKILDKNTYEYHLVFLNKNVVGEKILMTLGERNLGERNNISPEMFEKANKLIKVNEIPNKVMCSFDSNDDLKCTEYGDFSSYRVSFISKDAGQNWDLKETDYKEYKNYDEVLNYNPILPEYDQMFSLNYRFLSKLPANTKIPFNSFEETGK